MPSASPSYEPWPFEEATWWPTWSPTTWAPTVSTPPTFYIDYPFYFPHMAGGNDNGNNNNDNEEEPMMLADMSATKEPQDDTTTTTTGRSSQVEVDATGTVVKPHMDFFGAR